MKDKLIALLKQRGVTVPENATEEQLLALIPAEPETPSNAAEPNPDLVQLRNELNSIKTQRDNERKARIQTAVNGLVAEGRIPTNAAEGWVSRIVADESLMDFARNLPVNLPGGEPANAGGLEIVAESIVDIGNHCKRLTGASRTAFFRKHADRVLAAIRNDGVNTISTDLKRVALLDASMRAFKKKLFAFRAFSTVHQNVALQGTDQVAVPFYDLETAASSDFSGTYAFGDTTTSSRMVTVNKRKYQAQKWSSSEFRRQPYLNIEQLAVLKSEKLAVDIFTDTLSVITAANFPQALAAHDPTTVDFKWTADIKKAAEDLQWPEVGRSLIVGTSHDNALVKDSTFNVAFAIGSQQVKSGTVGADVSGFSYLACPNIPANGVEKIGGFACFVSAVLVATAPIEPTEEVRQRLTAYEIVVDDQTGIAFEYRRWGDADTDSSKEVIECNYGYAKGNANALIRLPTP